MKTFEAEIVKAIQHALVKMFKDGMLVQPDYANRIKVPSDLVQRVYALIDYEAVLAALKPKIAQLVADRIAAALAQELTTDVKRVLAHEPTRFRLRAAVMQALELPESADARPTDSESGKACGSADDRSFR